MNINAASGTLAVPYQLPRIDRYRNAPENQNDWSLSNRKEQAGATIIAEQYSRDSLSIEYTSKDGDSVSLSLEQVNYQKTMIQSNGQAISDEDMKKIVEEITKAFVEMKSNAMKKLMDGLDGKIDASNQVDATAETAAPALQIPEYWNAENTSQRIVDFATSFYETAKANGFGEQFLSMIKDAVDQGFSQAKDLMKTLPDTTAQLVNDTHSLIMAKLDAWWEGVNQAVSNTSVVESPEIITLAA